MKYKAGLILALFMSSASAGTTFFNTWSAASGLPSYSTGGFAVSTNVGNLAISASGLGVNNGILDYAKNEINQTEVVTIGLLVDTYLVSVDLSKFYSNDGVFPLTYAEVGQYRIDGGTWVDFTANSTAGTMTLTFNQVAHIIDFRVKNPTLANVLYDYSIASVTATPEPSTAALMLGAIVAGVPFLRRRITRL